MQPLQQHLRLREIVESPFHLLADGVQFVLLGDQLLAGLIQRARPIRNERILRFERAQRPQSAVDLLEQGVAVARPQLQLTVVVCVAVVQPVVHFGVQPAVPLQERARRLDAVRMVLDKLRIAGALEQVRWFCGGISANIGR